MVSLYATAQGTASPEVQPRDSDLLGKRLAEMNERNRQILRRAIVVRAALFGSEPEAAEKSAPKPVRGGTLGTIADLLDEAETIAVATESVVCGLERA